MIDKTNRFVKKILASGHSMLEEHSKQNGSIVSMRIRMSYANEMINK